MRHHSAVRSFSGLLASLLLAGCGGGDGSRSSPPPPPPTVTINVSPSGIPAGQPATVTWSSTNASTCTASGAWTGSKATSGSLGVSPPASGPYIYTLSCSASSSSAATASATLTVTSASLAITTATLTNGVIGTAYTGTIQATGGVAPFSWKVSSGALPSALSLSTSTTNTVAVSGMPQAVAQGVVFTIEVDDAAHHVATQVYTVSILGQTDSLVLSPASLDFGDEFVGRASGALTETLTNTATAPIVITSIAIAGHNVAEFNQSTTCGGSLAAGASCTIKVIFTPAQSGPRSAALTIIDDTAGSPHSLSLGGMGITAEPNATLSVTDLPFGVQLVGTTSPALSVVLTNYGTGTLNIAHVAATASFAETDNCIPGPAPGGSCTISVTFTPGASGDVTGVLSISDDALGSPQNVSLGGTGSTNTPLLTGYCQFTEPCGSLSRERASFLKCPPGRPAQHPTKTHGCWVGNVTVDGARSCELFLGNRHYPGFCEAK